MPSSSGPLPVRRLARIDGNRLVAMLRVTHAYDPGQLVSHRMTARKLVAAAPFDHQRQQ
jgi:hypothetical protein